MDEAIAIRKAQSMNPDDMSEISKLFSSMPDAALMAKDIARIIQTVGGKNCKIKYVPQTQSAFYATIANTVITDSFATQIARTFNNRITGARMFTKECGKVTLTVAMATPHKMITSVISSHAGADEVVTPERYTALSYRRPATAAEDSINALSPAKRELVDEQLIKYIFQRVANAEKVSNIHGLEIRVQDDDHTMDITNIDSIRLPVIISAMQPYLVQLISWCVKPSCVPKPTPLPDGMIDPSAHAASVPHKCQFPTLILSVKLHNRGKMCNVVFAMPASPSSFSGEKRKADDVHYHN
jgi:hypothetical protein